LRHCGAAGEARKRAKADQELFHLVSPSLKVAAARGAPPSRLRSIAPVMPAAR